MRIRSVLGLLAFSVLPSTLAAQGGCPALQAGSTVRLHAPSAATYRLPQAVQPADTAIQLPPTGPNAGGSIRCGDLQRVQLRVGPGSRGDSLLRGLGVGLLVGTVVGGGLFYLGSEPDESEYEILSRNEVTAIGAVLGGGAGLVTGGLIGVLTPGSRWRDVPLTPRSARAPAEGLRIAPAAGGEVRVSYTVAF
jgi:hypothetical protein